jgi:NADH:ubiquinone reductase (H+-translocating)
MDREARGGTLILGGGFGGAHVARRLPTATLVSAESSVLFTPLLPEVAAGALEPRHAFVPLREMCPHAELIRGRVSGLDRATRTVSVETEIGKVRVSYRRRSHRGSMTGCCAKGWSACSRSPGSTWSGRRAAARS